MTKPNRNLYIHAGGPKTGTSSLQNYLLINQDHLAAAGFSYEQRPEISSKLDITGGNGQALYEAFKTNKNLEVTIPNIILKYFANDHSSAICSSEFLSELSAEEWRYILHICKANNINPTVCFYIRDPLPFLASSYDQAIKGHGEFREFHDWLTNFDWQHIRSLRAIHGAFPPDSIHVFRYEDHSKSLIPHFTNAFLGMDQEWSESTRHKNLRANRSLTAIERHFIKQINSSFGEKHSAGLSKRLIFSQPNATSEPPQLTLKHYRNILPLLENDAKWVSETFWGGETRLDISYPTGFDHSNSSNLNEFSIDIFTSECAKWFSEQITLAKVEASDRLAFSLKNIDWIKAGDASIPDDFDPICYLSFNPDIVISGVPPYAHYISYGQFEKGRIYKWPTTR